MADDFKGTLFQTKNQRSIRYWSRKEQITDIIFVVIFKKSLLFAYTENTVNSEKVFKLSISRLSSFKCTLCKPDRKTKEHEQIFYICKNARCVERRCCYITVDSATTALQNGACTCWCISKQMH